MTHNKQLLWNSEQAYNSSKSQGSRKTHIGKIQYDVCGTHIGEQSLDVTTYENIGAETKMAAMFRRQYQFF